MRDWTKSHQLTLRSDIRAARFTTEPATIERYHEALPVWEDAVRNQCQLGSDVQLRDRNASSGIAAGSALHLRQLVNHVTKHAIIYRAATALSHPDAAHTSKDLTHLSPFDVLKYISTLPRPERYIEMHTCPRCSGQLLVQTKRRSQAKHACPAAGLPKLTDDRPPWTLEEPKEHPDVIALKNWLQSHTGDRHGRVAVADFGSGQRREVDPGEAFSVIVANHPTTALSQKILASSAISRGQTFGNNAVFTRSDLNTHLSVISTYDWLSQLGMDVSDVQREMLGWIMTRNDSKPTPAVADAIYKQRVWQAKRRLAAVGKDLAALQAKVEERIFAWSGPSTQPLSKFKSINERL